MTLNIPKANKKSLMETPMEYLKNPNTFSIAMVRNVDCFINLSSIQDPQLFANVPEDRLAASREAGQSFTEAFK